MATCASCGKEIRDDVWTCGFCGTPVSKTGGGAAADAPDSGALSGYGYAPGFEPQAAGASASAPAGASAAAPGGGLSRTTLTILIAAVVAVVAIIAVWFFFLRTTPGGQEYLGTWTAIDQKAGSMIVAKESGDFKITMVSPTGAKAGPFKGSLKDDALELKLEAANGDKTNKAIAKVLKSVYEAALTDPQLLLTVNKSNGHLIFTIKGKGSDGTPVSAVAAEFTKGTPLP
jgi:hypothetical protein